MSDWLQRAASSIIPLSQSKAVGPAMKEWFYTGRFYDLEELAGTCELCGQQDLRYHFEIANHFTSATLLVGSECIKRFDISGVDEHGRYLDAAKTGKLVDRHRRGLVEDARKRRVMTCLLKLEQITDDFQASSFLEFVDEKGAFTPRQVAMLFWRLSSAGVEYRPTDWKVRLRRESDYCQLRTMKPAAFKRVMAAFSPAQKKRVSEIEANFVRNGQRWREC